MEDSSASGLRRPTVLLTVWAVLLFASFILSIFLHEDGHGVGAKLDGIHVSTGFNKVGDYGKSPDQPDFRSSASEGGFWAGLLGPLTTWVLAAAFTVWLYRFKEPSWAALCVGALAVANAVIRALPMALVVAASLAGRPYMEDEVAWGIWYVLKYERPGLAPGQVGFASLLQANPGAFLAYPAFWVPPLLSLAISLVFLVLAYLRNQRLWGTTLKSAVNRWLFWLMPLLAYVLKTPVINWLDRMVRINW